MVDPVFAEDELLIDLDHLLDNLPDDINIDFCDQPAADGVCNSPDSLSIEYIEQYLMSDDSSHPGDKDQNTLVDEFFADVLLDSPAGPDSGSGSGSDLPKDCSTSPESGEAETDGEEKEDDKPHQEDADVQQTKENDVVDVVDDDNDDPVAKKRKRQIRNRDAAVRSRERKKMYVKDLEMKSKYYEAECKRLGILLQCYLAENQALRLTLHNGTAFDASMTKQESAVLLLESLLLGSLLGFLGIICLLILPSHHLLSTLEAGLLENVGGVEWETVAPRRAASKVYRSIPHSFMMGKRCKASRSRMKLRLSTAQVVL